MLTAVTYNFNLELIEKLGLDQTELVDAFRNEVYSRPLYQELRIKTTFTTEPSGVTEFSSDDWEADISHEDEFRDLFFDMMERAIDYCDLP